jgi:hypothetical protein
LSKNFKQILAIFLAVSNYINESNHQGFFITSIATISEALSVNKKTSLGKYLYQLISEQLPDTLSVVEELSTIPLCLSIDLDNTMSEMKMILKEINDIKNELDKIEEFLNTEIFEDSKIKRSLEFYYIKLLDFASNAMEKFEIAERLMDEVKVKFLTLTEKLGESKTVKISDIFTPIKIFLKNFKA